MNENWYALAEIRTRRMLADRTTWPSRVLCMKRIDTNDNTNYSAFGFVTVAAFPDQPIVIHPYGDGVGEDGRDNTGDPWLYATVGELLADGWLVD